MGKALTQQRGAEVGDAARWPRVRLGDVCEFIGGGTPDKSHSEYYGDEIPWVTVRDMTSSVITKTERCITRLGLERSAANLIPAGNVIISTHVGLGKVCLLAVDAAINQDLKAVIPISDCLSIEFLKTCFMVLADYIVSQGTGSTVKGVKLSFVQDLLIPLPPLSVQHEIVARLERELGAVDKLAKKFEELESAAEAEFKAELKETFEGAENKIQLAELEDSGRVVMGRGKIISKKDIAAHPGGYPVYSSSATGNGEIGRYGLYMFEDERITWSIDGGGRLYCRSAHRYSVTNVCGWLQVKDSAIEIRYLYYALTDAWSRIDFNYTHKAHPSVIRKEYFVAIPTLSAQRETVARLDAAKAKKEKLVATARRGRETAALMRKAILKEAFE